MRRQHLPYFVLQVVPRQDVWTAAEERGFAQQTKTLFGDEIRVVDIVTEYHFAVLRAIVVHSAYYHEQTRHAASHDHHSDGLELCASQGRLCTTE